MLEKMLQRRIGGCAVVGVPIADGDEKRAGQRKFRAAIGVADEKFRVASENRLGCAHSLNDHIGQLRLALMLEFPHPLKPPDARQKLAHIMPPPPLTIAD